MLFLGTEMAGRTKNATPKFFPRVVLELPYKKIGGKGRGPKAKDFFWKVCRTMKAVEKNLKTGS